MVGSLHSHRSTVAAAASSNYLKRLVFSRVKGFIRAFSLDVATPALPLTADTRGNSVDSIRVPNYDKLAQDEQGKTNLDIESRRGITTASGFSLVHSARQSLEESIRTAVEVKNYQKLPELFNTSKEVSRNPSPFMFLSRFSENQQIYVVDEILQSLIPIRPRSRPHAVYSYLLSYILESQNPLPLALAIIQRMLRSGCLPVLQTYLLLSKAWIERRETSQSVLSILQEMDSIGYPPDCGTCNYLILSLCKIDQFEEAVLVLHGMGKACVPDLDSYAILISEMSELRKTSEVVEFVKEMVGRHGLSPRKETILKALAAMRANRDIWRAAGMIEYLENEGIHIEFEAYELALEGCIEDRQFVLAGKLAIRMTERGFIPYIRVRQRVVEELVSIGEAELASFVRQRFAELGS